MPKVVIPTPYRRLTDGASDLRVDGDTILQCLEAVEARHAGFLHQVLTPGGELRRFVKLFLNGEQVAGDGLNEPVGPEDRVEILAAIAGG